MSKVLITGSGGFIGSWLIPLLKREHEVTTYDQKDGRDIFANLLAKKIEECDVVIHLAALTSVRGSFDNSEEVFHVNVLGTARVVELCRKYGKKLIYPSSGAVLHRELSPYGESKALAEDIVAKFPSNSTILRFFNVYGPGMNQDSGSLMYEFVKGLKTGKLVVFGDGEQTRDFIHVRDIALIIEAAISPKWNGKIVECGTGQAYSVNYIAGLFKHFGKINIEYEIPRREIKWSTANTQILKMLYKKKLTTNLEKDIKELVKYYEKS